MDVLFNIQSIQHAITVLGMYMYSLLIATLLLRYNIISRSDS